MQNIKGLIEEAENEYSVSTPFDEIRGGLIKMAVSNGNTIDKAEAHVHKVLETAAKDTDGNKKKDLIRELNNWEKKEAERYEKEEYERYM